MSSTAPLSVSDLDKQLKLVELQIQLEKAAKEREKIALERVQAELKLAQTKERLAKEREREKNINKDVVTKAKEPIKEVKENVKDVKKEAKGKTPREKKEEKQLIYPTTRRDTSIVDTLHGIQIPDPYRWLEDPDAPETVEWVTAQNKVTNSVLSSCRYRNALKARMEQLWNFPRYSCPFKRGDKYYYFKNDGLQNQSVLYQIDHIDSKEEKVLLDPNALSSDGTAALGVSRFSEDGTYYAYGVSRSGSDWVTIHVMTTDPSRRILEDQLEWVKFSSIAWTHDHKGFFYSRYPVPDTFKEKTDQDFKRGSETQAAANHSLYYHRLGTKQDEDVKIYADPSNPKWMMSGEVSDDGEYLLISINDSCDPVNRLYYLKLKGLSLSTNTNFSVVKLIDNFEAEYSYITNEGSLFFFKSNRQAPRYKVISIDLNKPEPSAWRDIIPHSTDVLDSVDCVNGNQLIVSYLHDVSHVLKLYDLTGKLIYDKFTLPDLGTVSSIQGRKKDSTFFYEFTSFLYPGTFYRFDLTTMTGSIFRQVTMPGFDASQYETRQVRYKSKDGTEIPMFLIHAKNMVKNKKNPTFLYGYGGFNISLTPSFSVSRLVFIQHFGGVYALANLRGGGEYGEEWHQAGTMLKKQNVFDDFIGAAEWLISNDYTTPKKLAINGGSNGGLLVAACINQRPELFGAAVAAVGVLDMLRFHKFTIGYAWCSDYGSPDKEDEFKALYAYSPYHNIAKGKPYPAVMLTTADHDDRVVPLHSYKYISALQHEVGTQSYQKNPLVIRIETKAGHGAGMPLSKRIQEQADILAFISRFTNTRLTGFLRKPRVNKPKTTTNDDAQVKSIGNGVAPAAAATTSTPAATDVSANGNGTAPAKGNRGKPRNARSAGRRRGGNDKKTAASTDATIAE